MPVTTLSFDNMHNHGRLFANLLRARHRMAAACLQNVQPEANGMHFDQYDTPASRWVAVHRDGVVLAGARLTPTKHTCGIYSYMIRDAQRGLLDTLPKTLLFGRAPVHPEIWEGAQVFVSDAVPACDRLHVQMQLIHEMMLSARAIGAASVIALMPEQSPHLVSGVGIDCDLVGPVHDQCGQRSVCVRIHLAAKIH